MPSKKKKYNARFPAGRIKKIMQSDEDVGKVAQAVPVIISRTLELFVESLLKKAVEITNSRNAKTLTPSHMKQCILSESRFDFLVDLVQNIPDAINEEDTHANEVNNLSTSTSRRRTSVETSHSNSKSISISSPSSIGFASHHPSYVPSCNNHLPTYSSPDCVSQTPLVQNSYAPPAVSHEQHAHFSAHPPYESNLSDSYQQSSPSQQYRRQSQTYQTDYSYQSSQNPAQEYQRPSTPPSVLSSSSSQQQEPNSSASGIHFNFLPASATNTTVNFNSMVPSYAPSNYSPSNLVIDEDYDN